LKEAVVALCRSGMSEVAVADLVGVSRLTVRAWRGKPVARSQK
jgi:transposase